MRAQYSGGIPASVTLTFSEPVLAGSLPAQSVVVDGQGSFKRFAAGGAYGSSTIVTRTLNTSAVPTAPPSRVSFLAYPLFLDLQGRAIPTVTDFPTT